MKPRTVVLILLGCFVICAAGCALAFNFLLGGLSGPPDRDVNLYSDGNRLYVAYSSSKKEHDVIPGADSGVKVDLNILPEHDSDNILTITYEGITQLNEQDTFLSNAFWSAKHQVAIYLRGYGESTSGTNVVEPGKYEIWMWTRDGGPKIWHSVLAIHKVTAFGPMTESLDGKWFCFRGYGGSGVYTRYIYLVNWATKQETWFATDMENGTDEGEFFMIDENSFFKCGSEQLGIRTKVFDKLTGKSRDSTIDGELEQFVEFQGEPWALRCRKGNYDVVKVNRQLDQVIQSIQIPTKL